MLTGMFGIVFFTLFVFLSHLMGAAAAEPTVALHQRLPDLDDETMQATFGTSRYHSATMKGNIGIFHADGDQWTDAQLREYFLTGIFQHYVHELCGFDMERGVCDLKEILGVDLSDVALHARTIEVLNTVISKLKENPIFVNLGICFHRNKINLEKCSESYASLYGMHRSLGFLKNFDAPEKMTERELRAAAIRSKVVSIIDIIDRTTIDQQTAFYYWMKEILERSVSYVKITYEASGVLPAFDDKDLLTICHYEPEFLEWPVYKELLPLALAKVL